MQVHHHLSQALGVLKSGKFTKVEADNVIGSATSMASDDHLRSVADAKALADRAKQNELCRETYMNDPAPGLAGLILQCGKATERRREGNYSFQIVSNFEKVLDF